jgi:sodium-dependent phosphate cotransporter
MSEEKPQPAGSRASQLRELRGTGARLLFLCVLIYGFLVSIGTLGKSFKMFSGGFVDSIIEGATNPVVGLFEGILATTLLQSSSTTTSIVVALVASGSMSVESAIFVVMGANIGTSVTNTLVSLGHIGRSSEFNRAFAASTVHDFFNIMAVVLLFPIQMATGILTHLATLLTDAFSTVGGLTFTSPLKAATGPVVDWAAHLCEGRAWLLLVASLLLLFFCLRYLVVTLKSLVMSRVEAFFDTVIFKNAGRAMLLGLMLTAMVQSSSITTSLVVPLAGAGILTLEQIFPYTLGANVGTTLTAILAALATGEITAVSVAFGHLVFNVCGIGAVWPVQAVRRIPLRMARGLAGVALRNRWLPVVYLIVMFYLLPFGVIFGLG